MIPQETVDRILDTARIDEVVGDFVTLRRRGANLVACCPFHNEKTPSFYVSPSKGIFKCFGCGKAGSAVGFVMEHEHYTYVEALKYLANKYHIEVQEKEETVEDIAARQRTESLMLVSEFAQKFFVNSLLHTDEGRNVGLAYLHSRGLDDETRKRLLGIIDDMPDEPLTLAIRLGLGAGLRNEEAIGLKWDNVDLDAGIIKIRSVICMAGGKVVEKGPKTSAGRREIPIDPDLTARLRRRAKEVFGTDELPKLKDFYVLGTPDGKYFLHARLTRSFQSFAKKWDIYGTTGELATFYSLRHTYATMLLRAGVDAKTVASLMGHSNVAMTLNVYASTDPQAKAAAGAVVADLMAQR